MPPVTEQQGNHEPDPCDRSCSKATTRSTAHRTEPAESASDSSTASHKLDSKPPNFFLWYQPVLQYE